MEGVGAPEVVRHLTPTETKLFNYSFFYVPSKYISSGNAVNNPTDGADRREFEWVKLTLVFHLLICCTLQHVMSGGASMNISYISKYSRMVHEEEEDTSSRDGVQRSLAQCFLFT